MLTVIGERGSGRTRRLIKEAYINEGVIVCCGKAEANYVAETSSDLKMPVQCFSLQEFQKLRTSGGIHHSTSVYLDNLELSIKALLGNQICGISLEDRDIEFLKPVEKIRMMTSDIKSLEEIGEELIEEKQEIKKLLEKEMDERYGIVKLAFGLRSLWKRVFDKCK